MPNFADSLFNLAVRQKQAQQFEAALDSYRRALEAQVARPEEAYLNRSVIYSVHLGQHQAAMRELQLALSCNPNFVPALLNLAKLYEDLGDRVQAGATYAKILSLDPCDFEALARHANMQPPNAADPQLIAKLRSALAHPRATAADRASVGFALGRLLDAAGDYAAAFAAYTAANQASRESAMPHFRPYDRAAQQLLVDRIIAGGTAPGPADPALAALGRDAEQRPVFICGMFRSGSTLAEQLLANYAGVVAGGELGFLPRLVSGELAPFPESLATLSTARRAALAARYRAELKRIGPGADVVTDKRPDNFLHIGLIKSLLPDARIVHTTRNPLDNCLSIYFLHLDQGMSYALDLEAIGHYYREYRRLMTHWKQIFADDIIDFDYDALVADPQPAMQRLCTFLGIEAGADARGALAPGSLAMAAPAGRAVQTASVWQVREPLYRRSSGRAANYAAELRVLEPYLSGLSP